MIGMLMLAAGQAGTVHMWGHAGGWGWFPFALVLWIGLGAAVIYLVTHVTRSRQPVVGDSRARDILAERFARGEISADEYEERLSHLS